MLKTKMIGLGFGGTQAIIAAIEDGFEKESCLIINSTMKDIPEEYEDISAVYSIAYGGSAKERTTAKDLCLRSLKSDDVFVKKIDGFVDPSTEKVILVAAVEGGTGSGSLPVMAKYVASVIKKMAPMVTVEVFAITGFQDDIRGLQNTIEFFQELDNKYTVQAISLKKFLDEGMTRSQAEEAGDKVFAAKVGYVVGRNVNYLNAKHNMDESDLYKLTTTPGFMFTFKVSFNKLKNNKEFEELVANAIDYDKSLEIPKQSIARLGIITNISEKSEPLIDYKFPTIRNKLGTYYELFQHDNAYDGGEEYIIFICAGLQMPLDAIQEAYDEYKKETESMDTDKDRFFEALNGFTGNSELQQRFSMGTNIKNNDIPTDGTVDKNDFFGQFEEPKTSITMDTVPPETEEEFRTKAVKNY